MCGGKSLRASAVCRKQTPPTSCENCLPHRPSTTRWLIVSVCLPHPDATTQFYMRLEEVKASTSAIEMAVKFQWAPGMGPPPFISRDIIAPIADMLITALQLAGPIIADAAKSGPLLQRRIREVTVNQINECLVAAKNAFPDAESFTDVPGTRPAGMSF